MPSTGQGEPPARPPAASARRDAARGASVKDVAVVAGVSLGTVSNVLNRPDRVSSTTRTRVEEAMRSLGYVRNESARQLRAGTSRVLAYVMLDAGNPFFTDVALGMEAAAEEEGLTVVLCHSAGRRHREEEHLALLEQQRVQGVLVTPVDAEAPMLEELRRRGTPVVVVDRTRRHDAFCSVAVDDHLGGALAVEHLVERGHERVAFVGGPFGIGQVAERLAGARAAWLAAGRPGDDLMVLGTEALDVQQGREAGMRLAGIPRRRRPTAAFCANDLLALGLLQHAIGAGTRVPEELAITGYDDIEFAAAAAVPLTSVRQPRHELGRAAARLVISEAGDPHHQHEQILFTPELVARRSTAGP